MCQIPNSISPPSPSPIPSPGPDPDPGGEVSRRRCRTSPGGSPAATRLRGRCASSPGRRPRPAPPSPSPPSSSRSSPCSPPLTTITGKLPSSLSSTSPSATSDTLSLLRRSLVYWKSCPELKNLSSCQETYGDLYPKRRSNSRTYVVNFGGHKEGLGAGSQPFGSEMTTLKRKLCRRNWRF
ncbi:unnamed protein product [Musa acuminata subsp. malaccensis]|uniref:(wild Malaysian banana) hypothetical protein n=1 Tax=Musa acuminata subsp. malaccensis TaxID=214687 RepID=A0A804KMT0_MUSAM|nr:unnamed protein product [Musa acuminata subsp. malaccensis]